MSRDWRDYLPAISAALILALAGLQTLQALRRSGQWSFGPKPKYVTNASDPYNRLERLLSAADPSPALEGMRDPFAYGRSTAPAPRPSDPVFPRPAPPAAARPILTAIVSDPQDPRAVINFENRNYSVRAGELFAQFRVVSISAEEVVLDNGRERLVLQRPTKGR